MVEIFFFDSYALFEIIEGNKNYEHYINANMVITKLNLFELFYGLLREKDEEEAIIALNKYSEFAIDFDKNTIEDAAKFRFLNRKRDLSMTDCVGYITAKKLGIKFLTGDRQFEGMDNVEFVK